jgi:hypothetical protein
MNKNVGTIGIIVGSGHMMDLHVRDLAAALASATHKEVKLIQAENAPPTYTIKSPPPIEPSRLLFFDPKCKITISKHRNKSQKSKRKNKKRR